MRRIPLFSRINSISDKKYIFMDEMLEVADSPVVVNSHLETSLLLLSILSKFCLFWCQFNLCIKMKVCYIILKLITEKKRYTFLYRPTICTNSTSCFCLLFTMCLQLVQKSCSLCRFWHTLKFFAKIKLSNIEGGQ